MQFQALAISSAFIDVSVIGEQAFDWHQPCWRSIRPFMNLVPRSVGGSHRSRGERTGGQEDGRRCIANATCKWEQESILSLLPCPYYSPCEQVPTELQQIAVLWAQQPLFFRSPTSCFERLCFSTSSRVPEFSCLS